MRERWGRFERRGQPTYQPRFERGTVEWEHIFVAAGFARLVACHFLRDSWRVVMDTSCFSSNGFAGNGTAHAEPWEELPVASGLGEKVSGADG